MNDSEIAKDILIKAMENGYIPKYSTSTTPDAYQKNIERITDAYKKIMSTVNQPFN